MSSQAWRARAEQLQKDFDLMRAHAQTMELEARRQRKRAQRAERRLQEVGAVLRELAERWRSGERREATGGVRALAQEFTP